MELLPNYQRAFIDIQKLKKYILNENHPIGKHKAKLFQSVLSISLDDAERFAESIMQNLRFNKAITGKKDDYGQRYFIDMKISNFDKEAITRTAWIVEIGSEIPRLITCYIII